MQGPPRVVYAAYHWHKLYNARTVGLEQALRRLNVVHVDANWQAIGVAEEPQTERDAADLELAYSLMGEICWGTARDDDTIVIGCGDHSLARLARSHARRNWTPKEFVFVSFAYSTTAMINDLTKNHASIRHVALERHASFRKYLKDCMQLDPTSKSWGRFSLFDKIALTAVERLYYAETDRKRPSSPPVALFRNTWIKGWLAYWTELNTIVGVATPLVRPEDCYNDLRSKNIVYEGSNGRVCLNRSNSFVIEKLGELTRSRNLYTLTYCVASKGF